MKLFKVGIEDAGGRGWGQAHSIVTSHITAGTNSVRITIRRAATLLVWRQERYTDCNGPNVIPKAKRQNVKGAIIHAGLQAG